MLGAELRASHVPGRRRATEPHPWPLCLQFCVYVGKVKGKKTSLCPAWIHTYHYTSLPTTSYAALSSCWTLPAYLQPMKNLLKPELLSEGLLFLWPDSILIPLPGRMHRSEVSRVKFCGPVCTWQAQPPYCAFVRCYMCPGLPVICRKEETELETQSFFQRLVHCLCLQFHVTFLAQGKAGEGCPFQ